MIIMDIDMPGKDGYETTKDIIKIMNQNNLNQISVFIVLFVIKNPEKNLWRGYEFYFE